MNESQHVRINLQIAFCLICVLTMPGEYSATAYGQERPFGAVGSSDALPSFGPPQAMLQARLYNGLSLPHHARSYGISRATLWRLVRKGNIRAPLAISPGCRDLR